MNNVFVAYDIQMVATVHAYESDALTGAGECETADSRLGILIDSADASAAALAALKAKPEVVSVFFTLYGRYADGTAQAVFDGESYQACADIYTAITGREIAPLVCDVLGLPPACDIEETSPATSRVKEINMELKALGYRMEQSLSSLDDVGHALMENETGELVDPPNAHILALAEEWTLLN